MRKRVNSEESYEEKNVWKCKAGERRKEWTREFLKKVTLLILVIGYERLHARHIVLHIFPSTSFSIFLFLIQKKNREFFKLSIKLRWNIKGKITFLSVQNSNTFLYSWKRANILVIIVTMKNELTWGKLFNVCVTVK